ncbi:MAG: glycogen/starch synthase, partial [Bacilli bacterium]
MNIVMIASEANPIYKTGGLADVIYALSKQFVTLGHNVSVILPYYKQVGKLDLLKDASPVFKMTIKMNWRVFDSEVYNKEIDGIEYFFISNDRYFDRPNYYGYYDDGERFAFFSNAAIELIKLLPYKVDIVHVHDWQPGMIPCLLKVKHKDEPAYKNIKTVLTIHNPLFKGYFNQSSLWDLYDLPIWLYEKGDVQFENQVSTLKAGIHFADKITTVSPTHAFELTTPEGSKGLWYEMVLRKDDFIGILNGMDYGEFNPSKD